MVNTVKVLCGDNTGRLNRTDRHSLCETMNDLAQRVANTDLGKSRQMMKGRLILPCCLGSNICPASCRQCSQYSTDHQVSRVNKKKVNKCKYSLHTTKYTQLLLHNPP